MDPISTADAVAKATPDVAALLDRHAKWSAQMCRNVPAPGPQMCRNVPSGEADGAEKPAGTCPRVPEHARTCHASENDKTNPPVYTPREPRQRPLSERPLTDRQLIAARLVAVGYGSVEIAHHLGVNRHTVAIWKRNPAFRVELGRLRAYLTASTFGSRSSGPRPLPSRPSPPPLPRTAPVRMTRTEIEREDRECEAMIAQALRNRGSAKGR